MSKAKLEFRQKREWEHAPAAQHVLEASSDFYHKLMEVIEVLSS